MQAAGHSLRILYLEPFDAGSHAQFTRTLTTGIEADWTVCTLPGRHWKWRMRGSAAHFALDHGAELRARHDLLLASSFTPLAELVGLVPELATVPAILYFHENQLAYPQRRAEDSQRDLHFGFTQLVSALAAQRCVFNSSYNRDSFVTAARDLLGRMPDAVPASWIERIEARSAVLGLPLDLPAVPPDAYDDAPATARADGPIILWNHRWEHDKNPDAFFAALFTLAQRNVPFRVAVCGERYRTEPPVFAAARQRLRPRIVHWGFATSRAEYEGLLQRAHLAVSTADHEFFGVAALEAAHHGAHPLVPDRLAYPELFPSEYRYRSDDELVAELERLVRAWLAGEPLRADRHSLTAPHAAPHRLAEYERLFAEVASC